MSPQDCMFRRFCDTDSLVDLTALLHQAYADHAAAGRKYFASYQTPDDTRRRISKGECWVAEQNSLIVGTVTLNAPCKMPEGYPASAHSGSFNQLAVLPAVRGRGLGNALLRLAEAKIADCGMREIVIDTSSLATDLIAWYLRHGYAEVGTWQWSVTNYQSTILRKACFNSPA